MNLIPKKYKIELSREYFNGRLSANCTSNPRYFWYGFVCYKWLWFEFKRKLKYNKDFSVNGFRLDLAKSYKDVDVVISYDREV